jgi:tetratricopeptide (TPR) repeat protein
MRLKVFVGVTVVLALSALAPARTTGRLTGEVMDQEGRPVEGAEVTITKVGDVPVEYTLDTDDKGRFNHAGLRPGQYTSRIEKEGYFPFEGELQIVLGDTVHYKVELQKKPEIPPEVKAMQAGAEAFKKGDLEAAAAAFEQAAAAKPDEFAAHFNLGLARTNLGQFEAAAAALEQAVKLAPESPDAQRLLAFSYIELSRNDDAIRVLQDYLKLRPDDTEAALDLGTLYFNADRTEEAVALFEQVAEKGKDSPDLHYRLGNAYLKAARYEEALEHLKLFLEHQSEHPDAGRIRTLVGDLEKLLAAKQ